MFERIRRSWYLMREAWEVLRYDRELVVFPIASGICTFLAAASFLAPVLLTMPWAEMTRSGGGAGSSFAFEEHLGPWHYVILFLLYLVTYFIVVFFNSALVACVRIRLLGGDPTIRDGFAFSVNHIGLIFQWSLVSATVGTVLRAVEERAGWLGQWVISLIGLAWTLATSFVVPVLVHDRVGPFEAVKRSAQIFRRTWGETVAANIGLGAAFGLLTLPGFLVLIAGMVALGMLAGSSAMAGGIVFGFAILLAVGYWIVLGIIQSALQGIFLTACYQYAISGEVPGPFTREHIVEAWCPKKNKKK